MNANSPAFPRIQTSYAKPVGPDGHQLTEHLVTTGLTKREIFAAMAMQAYCSRDTDCAYYENASDAVKQADALIAELDRTEKRT